MLLFKQNSMVVFEEHFIISVSALTRRKVQTVGPAYFNFYRIAHQNEESVWLSNNESTENEIEEDVSDDNDDLEYLKSLDPKECKVWYS